jgi:hypothetical protein
MHFQVFNVLGEKVSEDKFTGEVSLDVSGFTKGIYVIKIIDSMNNFSTQKLIIQ